MDDAIAIGQTAAGVISLTGPQGAAVGAGMSTALTLLDLINEYYG
jgi:hypothetical protein